MQEWNADICHLYQQTTTPPSVCATKVLTYEKQRHYEVSVETTGSVCQRLVCQNIAIIITQYGRVCQPVGLDGRLGETSFR
jgi:hypothetical protein